MKAVAKTKREPGVEVIETSPDKIADDEVLVRMRSASICGSDIGFYNFTPAYQRFAKVPVIMGHEFAGEVAEVGRRVLGFARGEKVSAESVIYCGLCRFCRAGTTNICQNFTVFGMHRNGGFAEYVALDPKFLHKVPAELSFVEAGVVEPLSVVVNALDDVADVRLGMNAVVVGPGPLGLFSAEALASKGVTDILIAGIDIDAFRLEIARDRLGYETVNTEAQDPEKLVSATTDGYGCDIVVVAAGAPAALKQAISLASKGGQIVVLGIFPDDVSLPASDFVRRQVSLRGSYGSSWKHYESAIGLLKSRKVRAEQIVSHRFQLGDADKAFEMAREKTASKVQFQN